jgi:sulfur-carrier protein adenylyltransferase/sulfurtransferase
MTGFWLDAWGRRQPWSHLLLAGAGMQRVPLTSIPMPARQRAEARWSRLAGALGEETLPRLQRMRVAVIGLGRNGSLMAHALARIDVQRLTLVDPDRIEPHNLDAMEGVTQADLGRTKVAAVANALGPGLDPC